MAANFYAITWVDVFASLVFILLCIALLKYWRIGLEKTILIGTLRTFVQLTLMGYLLSYIFNQDSWMFMVGLLLLMILVAGYEGGRRQKTLKIPHLSLIFSGTLLFTTIIVLLPILTIILKLKPWYYPYAMIPIGGMIIGNGLNSATMGVNRLVGEMALRKNEIEMLLSLGAPPKEATREAFRESVKASLIPTINAMMLVGLVQLPGVMTGQIMAGTDPVVAVRYQMMIMYMWVTVSALSVIITLLIVQRNFFNSRFQLKRELLTKEDSQ